MDLPERKHPRLKEYDYSQAGAYFITINTQENKPILSAVGRDTASLLPLRVPSPAETSVTLTPLGEIALRELLALETRYPFAKIDKYVIMPTHIHMILMLSGEAAASAETIRNPQSLRDSSF